jgi:ribonuclease P protein component
MRFRAEQHLRRQLDFDHVRTHGRRHDCGAFMLWYARQATVETVVVAAKTEPTTATEAPGSDINGPAVVAAKKIVEASAPARLGVVASRSAIGNAVQRARAKRRLREVFRHQQQRVPAGYDILLVGRSSLNRLEYPEIERRFVDACRKLFPSAQA